jgi:hypothetical protein
MMAAHEVTHVEIASIWIDVSLREQHNLAAEVTRHPVEDGVDITDHVREQPEQLQIEGLVTNQPIELPRSHMSGVTADAKASLQLHGRETAEIERMSIAGSLGTTLEGEPTLGVLGLLPGADQATTLLRTVGADVRSKRKLVMVTPKLARGSDTLRHATGLQFSAEFDRVRAVESALRAAFKARRPVQIVTGLRVYESMVLTDLTINRDASSHGALRFGATAESIRVVKSSSGLVGVPDPLNVRAKPAVDTGNQNTAPVAADEIPKEQISTAKQLLEGFKRSVGLQ